MRRRSLFPALFLALATAWSGQARAQDPSFDLVNRTGRPIIEVYATPSRVPNWGYDRLGSEVIPPGRSHRVRIQNSGDCVFDLRVVTAGGEVEDRRGLDTCRLREVVFGTAGGVPATSGKGGQPAYAEPAGNPSFNLLNRARQPIREIYASPASRPDWGGDLLGSEIVPPGRSYPVRLPLGECLYDLRVVYADGRTQDRRGVDTCRLSRVAFP
ncbi:hypothetical protein [Roseomonas sp. BN140053]|uniref:hypothetical protein n=1 Tax=Roseomonas sp. BN140053 TaxID=3391898 RepID=UPI0039EC00FF